MKQYPYLQSRTGKVLFGLFLFVMLLLARDTMFTHAILGFEPAQLLMLAVLGVFGLGFLICNRKSLKEIFLDRRMLLFAVSAAVMLLPMVVKGDWQLMYFSMLLGLFFGIFLTYVRSMETVAKYYILFMTALGIYSVLATYVLRHFLVGIVPTFCNDNGILFHNFVLSVVSDTFVKDRNFGIFREPGVYQYFIILALVLNNYMVSWKDQRVLWFVNVALAITMVTTFATGGVAELGVLVLVVFFDKKLYKDKRARIVAAVLVIAAVIIIIISILQKNALYWALWDMIVWKLMRNSESASDRSMSLILNTKMFLENPLVGVKISQVLYALPNNTSSTTILMAGCGISAAAVHGAGWVALAWDRNRKLWVNLALVLILFISFNTQNMVTDLFLWLFPTMALTEKSLSWLENRKEV